MTPRNWLNLGLAGLLLFYVIFIAWQAIPHKVCIQIGVDYCDYLTAARVANAYGYARVYDFQFLEQAQDEMLTSMGVLARIPALPFRYLPVFLLPFQPFSRLSPETGFWIWTTLNVAALVLYLRFFVRRLQLEPAPVRLLMMILACLPVFMNILTGQVNVWLMICTGEFMRALLDHKSLRAGLWLGGLLLKPQLLILMGMVLLLERAWKTLAGLAGASSALAAFSLLLTGPAGFVQMLGLWLATADRTANVWAEGMMNWRMLGVHLANIAGPWIGWGFAGAGSIVTVAITLLVWRRPFTEDLPSIPIAVAGIMAASDLVAWHAHIHVAMILIPPIVYLYQKKILPEKVLDYWVFLPAFLYMLMVFVPPTMMKVGILPQDSRDAIYFVIGAGEFSANVYLFWWAVAAASRRRSPVPS
jgi:hypothetical protein